MSTVGDLAKDSAEKAGSVIPVLYYDIIARIIPGCAFIAAVLYPNFPEWDGLTLIVWLGAGYLVGLLLTGLSFLLDLLWLYVATWIERRSPWGGSVRKIFQVNARFSPYNVPKSIDRVMREDPTVANVLFKMLAEATACENLITGYIVVWLIAEYTSTPTVLALVKSNGERWALFGVLFLSWTYRAVAVSARTGNWEPPKRS